MSMADREPLFLENAIEASVLETILKEEGIPYYIKIYRDPAYRGAWTYHDAYAHVECPEEYRERVRALLVEIRQSRKSEPEDS